MGSRLFGRLRLTEVRRGMVHQFALLLTACGVDGVA